MPNAELPVRLDTGQATGQEIEFLRVLDTRIVGQASGKRAAARAIRRALNKLRNKRGPVYKVLQIGKSRTGKTLTAESAALAMHGDSEALVYINCESYKQSHQIQQLLGAPPSYVGYKDPKDADKQKPGQVDPSALFARSNLIASRKGSKFPFTFVLLDEIEKASDELLDVLLGIFDKGKIRLANNTETDFTDCIFFLTSNLGMGKVEKLDNPMGFIKRTKPITEDDIRGVVTDELRMRFKPEFLKRIDEIVIFAPLTREQLEAVVDLEVSLLKERIRGSLTREARFSVDVKKSAREFVLARALADNGGVAEIKNVLDSQIADSLGNELAKGTIAGGDLVVVSHRAGSDTLDFELFRGKADPNDLVDLDKPNAAGGEPATGSDRLSTRDALLKIRELCEQKLVTTASQRSYNETTISIGSELRWYVRQMGRSVMTWDDIHAPLFESKAYELFWGKINNAYWYWRLLQACLEQTSDLPIKVEHVQKAVAKLRAQEGVADDYNLSSSTVVARLTVRGVLLIRVDPETHKEEIIKNRIFM